MKFQMAWEKASALRNAENLKLIKLHRKITIRPVRNVVADEEIKTLRLRKTERKLRKYFRPSTLTSYSIHQISKETLNLSKNAASEM